MSALISTLDQSDRRLLFGLATAALLLLVLVAAFAPPPAANAGFASSYATSPEGARAAFEVLAAGGYHVERWLEPPSALPAAAEGTVLILADPILAVQSTAAERNALAAYVARGGRVLVTGALGQLLAGATSIRPLPLTAVVAEPRTFDAATPGPLTAGAPRIVLVPQILWPGDAPAARPLYSDRDGTAAVLAEPAGRGLWVFWSGSTPLTNAGIAAPGSLELLLNSIGPPPRRVLWDEYYHGERAGMTPELRIAWRFFAAPFALLAVALLLSFGRRRLPPASDAWATARDSPLEFAEYSGGLYERARANGLALELLSASLARAVARARQRGLAVPPGTVALLERARAGPPRRATPLLSLARALREAELKLPR